MTIGINASFLADRPTGLGVFTAAVASRIVRLRADTVIFSPTAIDGVPAGNIAAVPLSVRGSLHFRTNLLRAAYINTMLPLRCHSADVDILYCPMLEYPFLTSTPLVCHVHDLHPLHYPAQFGKAAYFFRLSLRLLAGHARRIIVDSAFVRHELCAATGLQPERVDVIPCGYDSQRFRPAGAEGRQAFLERYAIGGPYIVYVGNLFPYKNVQVLVDAFLRLRGHIDHRLVIVGRREFHRGPLPDDERIMYLDYVPPDDLPSFYSYADLLVHPSLHEGFGLTPLEAMACGTPVVVSNRASLPEVVGDAGILFDPLDSADLAERIRTVIGDAGLRRRLADSGIARARAYSWERTAAGIISSCDKALEAA